MIRLAAMEAARCYCVIMRRLTTFFVLCAWLLASGAHWDVVQSFAWGRMIATYSRTMPLDQAVRLTFSADNLCGICTFVADAKTRVSDETSPAGTAPDAPVAAAKLFLALPPEHVFVFRSVTAPEWPADDFSLDACARPAPPTEPPRAA